MPNKIPCPPNADVCHFLAQSRHLKDIRYSRIVLALASHALLLALGDNALADPFRCEAAAQYFQFVHNVLAGGDDGFLGCDGPVGRHAELEGREERMGYLVGAEGDVRVLVEALSEEVSEGMVFFIEGKERGVGSTWYKTVSISLY